MYADALKLHHVGSTLHQVEFILFGPLTYGRVNAEDRFPLVVDVVLGRVEILGSRLVT